MYGQVLLLLRLLLSPRFGGVGGDERHLVNASAAAAAATAHS